jgi:hypothetical protein
VLLRRSAVSPAPEPMGDVIGQRADDAKRKPAPENAQQQRGIRALDKSLTDKMGHNSLHL